MDDEPIKPTEELKPREQEVLQLIADGLSNKDIAERLHIAVTTVRWHNRQLYSKLGVHTRTKAVAHARQLGLIDTPTSEETIATDPPSITPSNLPAQLTPFVGRSSEIAHIQDMLSTARLLTLTGSGGIGKTRLALQIAQENLENFDDVVWFVSLAAINEPDAIVSTIADTLQFQSFGHKDPTIQLYDFLRDKELLLILDNFEHLLDGAILVRDLLENAPELKILSTSREKLNLHAETVFVVGGLDFPESQTDKMLDHYGAIHLFLQTAQRVRPHFQITNDDFEVLINICRMVDGMPLGIELAAAWVEVLSLPEIEAEIRRSIDFLQTTLRDMPQRHQSIHAVFDSTWQRLNPTEQNALARLSVFQGGFTRDAALQIAEAPLAVLMALVSKSIISRTDQDRFQIHELLRRYAAEKLQADGAVQPTQHTYAAYFCQLVNQRKPDLESGRQLEALREIEADFANIRAAWTWAIDHQHFDLITITLDGLDYYFSLRSRFHEWLHLLQQASAYQHVLNDEDRAQVLVKFGRTQASLGNYQAGIENVRHSLEIAHRLEDADLLVEALVSMGRILCRRGEYPQAEPYLIEAEAVARQTENTLHLAGVYWAFADIANNKGDYAGAAQYCQQSLDIYQEMEDLYCTAHCLNGLGVIAKEQGHFPEAKQYFLESLSIRRKLNHRRGIASCLLNLGLMTNALDDLPAARDYYTESLAIRREIGDQWGVAACLGNLGTLVADFDDAHAYQEESLAIFREIGSQRGVAEALCNLGDLWHTHGNNAEATRYYSDALAIYQEVGFALGVATCLVGIGNLAREGAEFDAAWQAYTEAIQALDQQPLPITLTALLQLATMRMQQGQLIQAAQWVGVALHHPINDADVEKIAAGLLDQLTEQLSPDALEHALEVGQSLSFEEIADTILRFAPQNISSHPNGHH